MRFFEWMNKIMGREQMADNIIHSPGWPFDVEVIGDDLAVKEVLATAFGGASDPQDSGETASGVSTKLHPDIVGCALPMRVDKILVLRKSPIPKMPFGVN